MTHHVNELRTRAILTTLGAILLATLAGLPASASVVHTTANANFEGQDLDLSGDWGEAQACMVWRDIDVVECFRTEKAMDQRIAEIEATLVTDGAAADAQCSGSMRLYKDSGYNGQVLYIRDRLQWINLSGYSFSNETSSFKIGPCSTYLADGFWGGGSWYPTSQSQAWDVAPNMASGWNDRISSVYIG